MGGSWVARERRYHQRQCSTSRRILVGDPAPGRRLERRIIHWHRFSRRLLFAVSLLSPLVPGAGTFQLPQGERRKRSRPNMRVPLAQVADMATYIAKNKIRPKPEWQKNVAPVEDLANPFKIVHTQIPSAKSDRKPHPMINKRFPLVMMLEPLHACNLTCTGCGRIREYKSTINEIMTVEQCMAASDECGAPIVSICGGEPMIYPEIGRLSKEILDRGRHIILCTNGMFIRKRLHEFKPTSSFFFNVHLDGLERTHDLCVERDGVFREAIEGIKAAKAAGFLVCSNTTIYKETDLNEIADL